MRLWGKSQANRGCAVLLMAALSALSACASNQSATAPTVTDFRTQTSKSQSSKPPAKRAKRTRGGRNRGRPAKAAATKVAIDLARIRALAAQAAPDDPAEQKRLVREFVKWAKSRQKR